MMIRQGIKGKRGGGRVIYFYISLKNEIILITAYSESNQADISSGDKKELKKLTSIIKGIK